jgi:hypothetical protein
MTDLIKQVAGDLQKRIGGFGSEFHASNIGSAES